MDRPRQKNHSSFTIGSKLEKFQVKINKTYIFTQHSQPLYDVMQKEMANLHFFQGLNFDFIDSLEKRTKYLLEFDDSCEDICISKLVVDLATAGRHFGLSTTHVKHKVFPQNKFGPDVELQNMHSGLFKSLHVLMQVCTFSVFLGARITTSRLVSGRNTTSIWSFFVWFAAMKTRRLRDCTNTGSNLSKTYFQDQLKPET